MAKVKIQGNASGTGILTVTAPNTSTDRTITLPDSTATLFTDAGGTMTGNLTVSNAEPQIHLSDTDATASGYAKIRGGASGAVFLEADPTNAESNSHITFKIDNTQMGRFTTDGLCFNSDSAAANALDDYEEGTHQITPSMSSSGSITLSTSYDTFSYTKIGRLVTIIGNPRINSVSSPVGAIRLTLPFNVKNGQIDESRAGFVVSYFDYSAGAGNYYKQVNAYTQENTNLLTLENTNSSNNSFTPAGTDEFYFSFSYITD